MLETIIGIVAVFLGLIILLFLVRLVFALFFMFIINKYKNIKKKRKNKRSVKIYKNTLPKTDEDLSIKKVQRIGIYGQDKSLEEYNEKANEINKTRIVGVIKPIGRWTRLILGQRVVGLMQHMNIIKEQNNDGYWVNLIHSRMQGKERERGRY